VQARGEALPFQAGSLDVVFLNEVLEHVTDDRKTISEAARVVPPGGHVIIYLPNRLYPFETHGIYWRGAYHFGNFPLVNYLPNSLRERLVPHARAYTWADLRRTFAGLPVRVLHHGYVYPGFDNIKARQPLVGALLRRVLYALEHTPLQIFALSHFLVLERM
jgi:SAM-dependent methyltransferase